MKSEAKEKLDKIANIWNNFILEYKSCSKEIKFTKEVRTNYFGDILGYFNDTFDVVFKEKRDLSYSEEFHIILAYYKQFIFIRILSKNFY